jgi:hypothetical protein
VRLERKRNEELGFKVTTTPGFVPAKLKGDRRSRSDGAKQPDWLLAQAGLSFPGPGPGCGLGAGERVRALRRAGRGSGRGPLREEQGCFRSLGRAGGAGAAGLRLFFRELGQRAMHAHDWAAQQAFGSSRLPGRIKEKLWVFCFIPFSEAISDDFESLFNFEPTG